MASSSPGQRLRDAARQGTLAVPGAFNALVARMIQRAGFPAMYLSGAAFSAGQLALPDVGLFTLTELAQETPRLTRAASIPLIVDADTGFGAPLHVERTIAELEAAGAAAVQLEDQQLPKRCGHLSGKSLVPAEEMCAKLRAAAAARRDAALVIVARTDARAVEGFEAAVSRARQYLAAGADWIFPEALETPEEFQQFAQQVGAPLLANMTEFGRSPLVPLDQWRAWGYAAVLFPVTLLRVAMHAVDHALGVLGTQGTQQSLLGQMQTRQALYDLLGYLDYEQRDRAYFGAAGPGSGPGQPR